MKMATAPCVTQVVASSSSLALGLPILVFLMDPSICDVEVLEWWRRIVKDIEEKVRKEVGEGRKGIWVVEGGENKEDNPAAANGRPVDKGRRPVDPRRVTKWRKGLGEEEGRELGDFKMGAAIKRLIS